MDSVQQACQQLPIRNQPQIAAIVGEGSTQYFVICESKVLCEVPTLQVALFTAFSAYYCFNLEYPASAKNIFCFFQDYILEHPDSNKKSGTYLAMVSDIKRNLRLNLLHMYILYILMSSMLHLTVMHIYIHLVS